MNCCDVIFALLILSCSLKTALSLCPEDVRKYSIGCAHSYEPEVADFLDAIGGDYSEHNNLCGSNATPRLLDKSSGRVEFAVYFRREVFPLPNSTTYVAVRNLQSNGSTQIHSFFDTSGSDTSPCSNQQFVKLVWITNYVSNGDYQLNIENLDCTLNFNVTITASAFIADDLLALYPEPSKTVVHPWSADSIFGSKNTLNVKIESDTFNNDCDNSLLNTSCAKLTLRTDTGNKVDGDNVIWIDKFYKLYNDSSNCTEEAKSELYKQVNVSCNWLDGSYLECRISNLPPGPYVLNLEVSDTRCTSGTRWAASGKTVCQWEINIDVKDRSQWFWFGFATVAALVSITAAIFLLPVNKMLRYLLKLKIFVNPGTVERPCRPSSPKVLLLYPRDCDPLMKSMSQLRKFLVEDVGVEVFDIWDESQAENIATVSGMWALQYLMDENVDVVLVTSPLTSRFEDALSKGLIADHKLKDSRDEVFLIAFKTASVLNLIHHSHRFITVRLNNKKHGEDALTCFLTNPSFSLSKPKNLRSLISYLHGHRTSENVDFSSRNITSLAEAIKAYSDYVSSTPKYSDDILLTPHPPVMEGSSVYSFISNFNKHLQHSTCSESSYLKVLNWLGRQVSAGTAPSVITCNGDVESCVDHHEMDDYSVPLY